MKKLISTAILLAMFATFCTLKAQTQKEEYLGLPGDNLNLYAVMKLFQESETLEGFERNLNDENSRINNLDLNADNYVDYIKVIDYVDGEVHNIVLQVSVNARENQDVAVFTVQRFTNGQVQIQLIGDENLYGRNYIIEPIYDENIAGQTPNPGYMGNSGRNVDVARTTTYEIATWPVIRFIYLPSYRVWHSSWYWDYYPSYWHPWKPYYYHYYYGYHYNSYNDYYRHYRRWDRPRYSHWNDFYYTGYRSHSTYVSININKGSYKTTYSRPEERRRGEALYESTRVSQNNSNRRSSNQVVQSRQATGNNTSATRRTTTTTRNSGQVNSSGQNSNQTRRTTTPTVQNRSSEQAVSRQTNSGARRSTTTQTKSSAQPSSGQNTSTVRRTSTTVNRPATTPSSSQGNNSVRRTTTSTTVKQQAARPSSSGSSAKSRMATRPAPSSSKATSRQNSNTSSSSKSSERKKAAEPTSSSRRK